MSKNTRTILIFLGSLIILGALLSTVNVEQPKEIDMATLATRVESGEVKRVVIRGPKLEVTFQDDSTAAVTKESTESFSELLKNYGVSPERARAVQTEVKERTGAAYWAGLILPNLIPIVLLFVLMWLLLRQVQGQNTRAMSFGQSTAREMPKGAKDRIAFKDVAGAKEAKEELHEVVDFLKSPEKFKKLGAKIPKGVLLMGSPGTGKTLLARAVAGEANVPFFHISGSEFVEMFVGVGASRVRDLFTKAKKSAPCIVFIDEIDAVGRQRGSGLGGSHDEREQTLNQILVEMDGFEPNLGVIVLAATNRPDVLDPALLRPGRFDRRIVLDMPDINDREAILHIHAKKKPFAKNVDLRRLAERTPGFSGADLANLMNEAAILAARQNKHEISMNHLLDSIEKVMLGPERRSHVMTDEERKVTATHETGHALIAHLLPHTDPVQKVSIISRGRAAGYTIKTPLEDRHMKNREEYVEELAVMMGGYAAESVFFNDVTPGASNDMREATKLARRMVTQWGMSDALGPRTYGEQEDLIFLGREIHENRDYSEKTAEKIDAEIDRLISDALETAKRILETHRDRVNGVVQKLLVSETLEREQWLETVGLPPANEKNVLTRKEEKLEPKKEEAA
ncbi:ATP-dependent zinc metalloprotease FtsH [Patescibacteria group bacterium]|uniref:ATP-dependent zinc metalloprotease FtsH n=1 Tax=candidate division WWE3 bacterium TaxID=2053526 RepID=A0A928TQ11_UNCKA|nr:ATP-dependent zinc metalloprotease FtsH [candidate division WWE3 bacterium]MCL4732728.1 ATP-dependent zinc metalloprotease FtsH [Patescibacteria group bacterium]MDL1952989.1 ATP-dependent zinc metalloprotease FtsH [Candidatus Uhrbacteria bacterium UHB]RIL00705.1 MAG: cell division protein FtsH [Candidatus Uhrbacteria bacterium]